MVLLHLTRNVFFWQAASTVYSMHKSSTRKVKWQLRGPNTTDVSNVLLGVTARPHVSPVGVLRYRWVRVYTTSMASSFCVFTSIHSGVAHNEKQCSHPLLSYSFRGGCCRDSTVSIMWSTTDGLDTLDLAGMGLCPSTTTLAIA